MNPTSEVLKRIISSSQTHVDGVFTRLYRYLLREDIYLTAYKNLYANQGAATKGTDNDTADGFGTEYIAETIEKLRTQKYTPKPTRRTYIPKQNGKLRPLGIPSFRDKLVQDCIRQILEAIYEPLFSDNSHGFRPNRSCHTAFDSIRYGFNGTRWFIEGDIKGCFDNIGHKALLEILSRKIKDSKFINLIGAFLKAGYMEDWTYHGTFSGTPQGGILSPILANIYLNELDKKVDEIAERFTVRETKHRTKAYGQATWAVDKLKKEYATTKSEEVKKRILKEIGLAKAKMAKLPVFAASNKRLRYVRYADDFIIGISGSREDCQRIKAELKAYLAEKLSLELSDEKTKITHSSEKIRFLGYDVCVRRSNQLKRRCDGVVQRTLNGTISLSIPLKDKIEAYLISNEYGVRTNNGRLQPVAAKGHRNLPDNEIISLYNAQIRGICNYYRLAGNFAKLDYFVYIMEYSCLKTLASKHQCTMAQARANRRIGKRWGVRYVSKSGDKTLLFLTMTDIRASRKKQLLDVDAVPRLVSSRNELANRLKANICELCGTDKGSFVIHHVKNLKALTSVHEWERKMLAIRRKTLVVCKECHKRIHQ